MTDTHPARDAETERWLTELGATWTFDPEVPLARINRAASLANQVRQVPLNTRTADQYAAAMTRGDQFPPILLTPDDTGDKLTILGGLHRYAAGEQIGLPTHPAYLIHADARTLLRISIEDNGKHGLGLTEAERLDHAFALIGAGYNQHEAATIAGVSQPAISIAKATNEAARRARDLGVDDRFHLLPRVTRHALSRLSDDAVFAATANLAAEASLSTTTVRALVDAALAVDRAEALRIVEAEAADHADRKRDLAGNVRRSSRSPRAQLDSALAVIKSLDPQAICDACPNDDVREILAQRIMEAAAVLAPTRELLVSRQGRAA